MSQNYHYYKAKRTRSLAEVLDYCETTFGENKPLLEYVDNRTVYQAPAAQIIHLEAKDIITASDGNNPLIPDIFGKDSF